MTYSQPPGDPPPGFGGYRPTDEQTVPLARRPVRRPDGRSPSSPLLIGFVYGAIGLVAVAAAAVTFLIVSPPSDLIRNQIVARVKAETGRDLRIAGPASFTFYPVLGIRLGDVSLSGPPGMEGGPLATISSLDVGVRILPLLSKEIVIDRLILNKPVFDLRVDSNGQNNWDMAAAHTLRPVRLAQASANRETLTDFPTEAKVVLAGATAQPSATSGSQAENLQVENLVLGDIRLVDGTIRYTDERQGSAHEVGAINARLGLNSIAHPLEAKGDLTWSGEKIDFDGRLASPKELMEDRPAKLVVTISSRPLTLSYDGSVTLKNALDLEGAVDGKAASLRALAAWLGTKLPPARGFGAVSLAGRLRATGAVVRLSEAKLALDGATATGTIGVETTKTRPHVVANLNVADLNLGNYLSAEGGSGERRPAGGAAPAAPATETPNQPQSIEDLLSNPGPQVKGYAQRAGWSREPIDLATLGALDADAKLSVVRLSYNDIRVNASELYVALKNQVLKTTFEEVQLYKGRGKGFVTLDGTGAEAIFGANFSLDGVAAQPLLKDAAQIDWLAGTGKLAMTLSGRGRSQADIVGSLNGKADIAVTNGALIGFNLAGAMRALSEGKIPDFATSASEKTDFSQLTANFIITNGIAENTDLKLASPLLRATGAGTVHLPQRQIDYTVRPRLVATLDGQGGEQDTAGIEIPVRIHGPWDQPEIAADIAGAINNPKTMEAVKEIGKQFQGKDAGKIVKDLFGKGEGGEPSKAEKLLDQFLGR